MCLCQSCKATDKYADKGFAAWPRGEPAGPRSSKALYAAHVAFGKADASVNLLAASPFPCLGTVFLGPHTKYHFPSWGDTQRGTQHYVEAFVEGNNYVTEKKLEKAAAYRREVERAELANARIQGDTKKWRKAA